MAACIYFLKFHFTHLLYFHIQFVTMPESNGFVQYVDPFERASPLPGVVFTSVKKNHASHFDLCSNCEVNLQHDNYNHQNL